MIVVKCDQGDLFVHQAMDIRPGLEARSAIPTVDANRPVEDVAQAQSQRTLGEELSVGRCDDRRGHVVGVPQQTHQTDEPRGGTAGPEDECVVAHGKGSPNNDQESQQGNETDVKRGSTTPTPSGDGILQGEGCAEEPPRVRLPTSLAPATLQRSWPPGL